ncbi:MAG: hypothetical protein F6J93_18580 [Oscillatoria sp. SIO1A7]|nr:hypothetical protein [Oscillatoria sp. SIO1A7]
MTGLTQKIVWGERGEGGEFSLLVLPTLAQCPIPNSQFPIPQCIDVYN